MKLLVRYHSCCDLIVFVYAGVPAQEAAQDFIRRVKESAEPVLGQGRNAVVPIILDGENAWESYPRSGREFLRRLCVCIQEGKHLVGLAFSEAGGEKAAPARRGSVFFRCVLHASIQV